MIASMEQIINKIIQSTPNLDSKLAPFSGKSIGIHLPTWSIHVVLIFEQSGVSLLPIEDYHRVPDMGIKGSPLSLLFLAVNKNRQAFFQGDIHIEGDVHWLHALSQLLHNYSIDWTQMLSEQLGNFVAQAMIQLATNVYDLLKDSTESLKVQAVEYSTEEARLIPSTEEIQAFFKAIESLRDDVDRMEIQLERFPCAY